MRITGRQLRRIIKEELSKGIDWKQVEDAMWPEAVPALQAIWGKTIPVVEDDAPLDLVDGLMVAIGSILGPSMKIWGNLGRVGDYILFSDDAKALFSSGNDHINAQLVAVRIGLDMTPVGGWDPALQERTADLLQKKIAGGGMLGSELAKRSVKIYPADNPAQAQTKGSGR